jgi:FkbM family methyltransferase
MISYAQNFEDVMLSRALAHVANGFYIDLGAQDPVVDSVSLAFYERGWRGVHVEPTPAYAQALRDARPDETVVQAAIGEASLITLYEIPDTGLSTADADFASKHEESGFHNKAIEVPCIPLASLLDRWAEREIHWLKIDVEGMEESVLRSWTPSNVRPWIVVIEATLPRTPEPSYGAWEHLILALGYEFAYFDGLNRFYISAQHRELLEAFDKPPNVFDEFSLSGLACHGFCNKLKADLADARQEADALRTGQARLQEELNAATQPGTSGRGAQPRSELLGQRETAQGSLAELESLRAAHDAAMRIVSVENARLRDSFGTLNAECQQALAEQQTLRRKHEELNTLHQATLSERQSLSDLLEVTRAEMGQRQAAADQVQRTLSTSLESVIDALRREGSARLQERTAFAQRFARQQAEIAGRYADKERELRAEIETARQSYVDEHEARKRLEEDLLQRTEHQALDSGTTGPPLEQDGPGSFAQPSTTAPRHSSMQRTQSCTSKMKLSNRQRR